MVHLCRNAISGAERLQIFAVCICPHSHYRETSRDLPLLTEQGLLKWGEQYGREHLNHLVDQGTGFGVPYTDRPWSDW